MSALDDEVRTVKLRIEQAQRDRVRAEAQLESAKAAMGVAAAALADEFNVSSLGEAGELRAQLEEELQGKLDQALQGLEAIGR